MTATIDSMDYALHCVYQALSRDQRNEIIVFWLENGALTFEDANHRVDQVVVVARNAADELVGVTSVYRAPFGEETFLHYRTYIRPQDRVPGLMMKMLRETREYLDAHPSLRGTVCGLLIRTENEKLMRPGVRRRFQRSVWNYEGQDKEGCDVWRFDFREPTAHN